MTAGDLVLDADLRLRCAESNKGLDKLLAQGKIRAPIDHDGKLWIAVETDDGYTLHEVAEGIAAVPTTGLTTKGLYAKHKTASYVFTGETRAAKLAKSGADYVFNLDESTVQAERVHGMGKDLSAFDRGVIAEPVSIGNILWVYGGRATHGSWFEETTLLEVVSLEEWERSGDKRTHARNTRERGRLLKTKATKGKKGQPAMSYVLTGVVGKARKGQPWEEMDVGDKLMIAVDDNNKGNAWFAREVNAAIVAETDPQKLKEALRVAVVAEAQPFQTAIHKRLRELEATPATNDGSNGEAACASDASPAPQTSTAQGYPIHELCALLPAMSADEYRELVDDIRANGLRDAITLYEGKILDGRHRDRACRDSGREPRYEALPSDQDPFAFVMSRTIRRTMTASQRAMLATDLSVFRERAQQRQEASRLQPGERPGERNVAGSPAGRVEVQTNGAKALVRAKAAQEAGAALGVSPRMVEHATRVADKGVPELAEKVRAGDIPVHVASEIASAPPAEQRAVIALDDEKAIKKRAKEIATRDREKRQAKRAEVAIEKASKLGANPVGVEILNDADAAIALVGERGGARLAIFDPPWDRYEQKPGVVDPELTFPTLSLDQIGSHFDAAAEVATNDARMVVWITCPLLAEALTELASAVRANLNDLEALPEDTPWRRIVAPKGWTLVSMGAWVKTSDGKVVRNGTGHHWRGAAEIALLFVRGSAGEPNCVIPNGSIADRDGHSEKPPEWTREWLKAWTDPGDNVLVPYLGLGNDAKACMAEGRRCIAAEKHEGRRAEARLALQPPAPLFDQEAAK